MRARLLGKINRAGLRSEASTYVTQKGAGYSAAKGRGKATPRNMNMPAVQKPTAGTTAIRPPNESRLNISRAGNTPRDVTRLRGAGANPFWKDKYMAKLIK